MKYHHNTVTEAFRYLVEKRPQIWPNQGFMLQLIHYENELIKSREILSTSETSEAFNSTAVPSTNDAKSPIETLYEFKKRTQLLKNDKSDDPCTWNDSISNEDEFLMEFDDRDSINSGDDIVLDEQSVELTFRSLSSSHALNHMNILEKMCPLVLAKH
ncbi:unnamed protein product [Rotaria magnacalcarata]|nr:unnamed protein product [Rotaria magnacalcarata]CAF4224519.1 unnamed protein product [Rotaria magnacalcarata]